jgi:hypothetical protein
MPCFNRLWLQPLVNRAARCPRGQYRASIPFVSSLSASDRCRPKTLPSPATLLLTEGVNIAFKDGLAAFCIIRL